MAIPYTVVQSDETAVLTAIVDGKVYVAEKSHPNWAELVRVCTTAQDEVTSQQVVNLFNLALGVADYFDSISERVSVAGNRLYFDGEEVNDALSSHILRFINENESDRAAALVNFMEKVNTNPNEHSRNQLYDWLARRDFTITEDGDFIAYKGVKAKNVDDETKYESISTGRAMVDGHVYNGAIPNYVGAVVTMPRNEVQHDPSVGCHTGLHAGTWVYASSFARGAVLKVVINPRDVVSVPTDSDWQKIRTCRYTVLDVTDQEYVDSLYEDDFDDEDELDEDFSDDVPDFA